MAVGTNLLRFTGHPTYAGAYSVANLENGWCAWNSGNGTFERTDGGIKYTASGSSNGFVVPLYYAGILKGGSEEVVTISFKYRGTFTGTFPLYLINASGGNVTKTTTSKLVSSTSEWAEFSDTLYFPSVGSKTSVGILIPYTSTSGKWFEVKDSSLKLELGSEATEWVPSPFDEGVTGIIKATAEVTITDETDIDKLVPWYQLTGSTTPPSAPTTTQTSASVSDWTQNEPSFDPAQGTKYLYTVWQTQWKDGSCTWGAVQLSSSYEQAKQAWNKANAAQNEAAAASAAADSAAITRSASGQRSFVTTDAADLPLLTLSPVLGESVQDGTPTPSSPVPIKSVKLVWNQLVKHISSSATVSNGVTHTWNGDGSITVSGKAEGGDSSNQKSIGSVIAGHKYLIRGCPAGGGSSTYYLGFGGLRTDEGSGGIFIATSDGTANLRFQIRSGTTVDFTIWPEVFDLTIMFGAGNEPETVAEFEAMFPEDYYEYEAGKNCLLVMSELEGTVVGRSLIDLKGHELHGLDSTYRDQLDIDASGMAVIRKRTDVQHITECGRAQSTDYASFALADGVVNVIPSDVTCLCDKLACAQKDSATFKTKTYAVKVCRTSSTDQAMRGFVRFGGTESGLNAFNETLSAMGGIDILYPLAEENWYDIPLGHVDLPQVTDGATVHVEAEVRPVIGGSWWTKAGEATGRLAQQSMNSQGVLEAPYTEVEWVESNGTQYVYLDWKPPMGTWGFEADFISYNAVNTTVGAWNASTNMNGYGSVFITRYGTNKNGAGLSSYNGGWLAYETAQRTGASNTGFKADHTRQQISLIGSTYTKPDGSTVTLTRGTETADAPYSNMTVFAKHEGSRKYDVGTFSEPGSVRIYSLKFYDGTELKVDLVGAIRKRDNATGLYDKVKGHFYPALGMSHGNPVGDLGKADTVVGRLAKGNIKVNVDNRAITRMWIAHVPELDDVEDGQQMTVVFSSAVTATSPSAAGLVGWNEDNSKTYSYVYLKTVLADSSETEWIPCYYSAGSRLTNHYAAGTPLLLTYRENVMYNATTSSAGTSTARGWFADPNYNTNTTYDLGRNQHSSAITAYSAITKNYIICGTDSGYVHLAASVSFDLSYPLLYATANIAAAGTATTTYETYNNITFTTTGVIESGAAKKTLYLKGTVSGNTFTVAASNWLTTVVPNSDDGCAYIPLGIMTSATAGYFQSSKELYCYKDGAFGPTSIREAAEAAKYAGNYIIETATNDVWVHSEGHGPQSDGTVTADTYGWRIGSVFELVRAGASYMKMWIDNSVAKLRLGLETAGHAIFDSTGMEVKTDASTSAAKFGAESRVGLESSGHVVMGSGGSIDILNGSTTMAHFGYGDGNKEDGTTETAPYFTLGTRGGSTAANYDPTRTYSVGSLAKHNDVLYVCTVAITTAEAWDSSHWKLAVGAYSVSEGTGNIASGETSHAEGATTKAIGYHSHSEGGNTKAIGNWSHAEGSQSIASGTCSHSEGGKPTASGPYSHAEGWYTTASGSESHSEGNVTTASGASSHAEGNYTTASGICSHAAGSYTIASGDFQTVIGQYNVDDTNGDYAFIIGNGLSTNARKNALTVDWSGNLGVTGEDALFRRDFDLSQADNGVSANTYGSYGMKDVNDVFSGFVQSAVYPNGDTALHVGARNVVNGNTLSNTISLYVDASGNARVSIYDISPWLKALFTWGQYVAMSADKTLTTSAQKLPLLTFTGNGCTSSSNGIKVPSAGKYAIWASYYCTTGFTSGDILHLKVYKGSTAVTDWIDKAFAASPYTVFDHGPYVLDCSANDVLYLYAYNQTASRGTVSKDSGVSGLKVVRIG